MHAEKEAGKDKQTETRKIRGRKRQADRKAIRQKQ
jgi:hypothetical protein